MLSTWQYQSVLLTAVVATGCAQPQPVAPSKEGVKETAPDAAAFRRDAQAIAADSRRFVTAWGTASLDEELYPEPYAVLCPLPERELRTGLIIIQKGAARRWQLAFDGAATLSGCDEEPGFIPPWRSLTNAGLVYRRAPSESSARMIILRTGRPVLRSSGGVSLEITSAGVDGLRLVESP